jgi:hypothetical protein
MSRKSSVLTMLVRHFVLQHRICFEAVCELVARSAEAVAIFKDGWKQTSHATAVQVAQWIKDLDSYSTFVAILKSKARQLLANSPGE